MIEIFHENFEIEYDFKSEMPNNDENKMGVVMSNQIVFDFESYIIELIQKFGKQLTEMIPLNLRSGRLLFNQ